jgi:hypothetical protein
LFPVVTRGEHSDQVHLGPMTSTKGRGSLAGATALNNLKGSKCTVSSSRSAARHARHARPAGPSSTQQHPAAPSSAQHASRRVPHAASHASHPRSLTHPHAASCARQVHVELRWTPDRAREDGGRIRVGKTIVEVAQDPDPLPGGMPAGYDAVGDAAKRGAATRQCGIFGIDMSFLYCVQTRKVTSAPPSSRFPTAGAEPPAAAAEATDTKTTRLEATEEVPSGGWSL